MKGHNLSPNMNFSITLPNSSIFVKIKSAAVVHMRIQNEDRESIYKIFVSKKKRESTYKI